MLQGATVPVPLRGGGVKGFRDNGNPLSHQGGGGVRANRTAARSTLI